jgi:hypothetical protein
VYSVWIARNSTFLVDSDLGRKRMMQTGTIRKIVSVNLTKGALQGLEYGAGIDLGLGGMFLSTGSTSSVVPGLLAAPSASLCGGIIGLFHGYRQIYCLPATGEAVSRE